jgi:hypothetical protein
MKKLLMMAGVAVLLLGCAAPPASEETAESETGAAVEGEAMDTQPGGAVADEGFDDGETGELEPTEDAPAEDEGH